jgi:hypothetical protein
MRIPLTKVIVKDEEHAHKIWGYNLVLVRADGHVAWRGEEAPDAEDFRNILKVVTGENPFPGYTTPERRTADIDGLTISEGKFSTEDFLSPGEKA